MIERRIWVMTLFPEFFQPLLACGIAGQALRGERAVDMKLSLRTVNVRDWGLGNYGAVDDTPYGGGPGMVMRADVLAKAFHEGVMIPGGYQSQDELTVIYTSPRGVVWDNKVARDFGERVLVEKDIVLVCGRYEGIDERFIENYVDQIYSIGDYVLTGGELAVMTLLDSSVRFVPGILGNKSSASDDSFEDGLLECPQYTKPREFEGASVPEVLSNGNHAKIKEWQQKQKEHMTKTLRPDLWNKRS